MSVAKRIQANVFVRPLISVPASHLLNPNGTTVPLLWVEEVHTF